MKQHFLHLVIHLITLISMSGDGSAVFAAASFLIPSQALKFSGHDVWRGGPLNGRTTRPNSSSNHDEPPQNRKARAAMTNEGVIKGDWQSTQFESLDRTRGSMTEAIGTSCDGGVNGTVLLDSKTRAKGTKKRKDAKRRQMSRTGNIPDIQWRAIPMEHLRNHPCFVPLPYPDEIVRLKVLEDVRYFRQDSWQWDALHAGRCTTSQAAAALGLLEPKVGGFLGIPRSLRKGGIGAYQRLRQTALRDLDDISEVLCTGGNREKRATSTAPLWISNKSRGSVHSKNPGRKATQQYPFAAIYVPRMTEAECNERRNRLGHFFKSGASPFLARMQWGSAQEATALLTALNYFWKKDPHIVIKEVGMCGAGLEMNRTNSSASNEEEDTGLIIGASPDAVIQYPNGTLEALEVKNHCPFVPATFGGKKFKKTSTKGNPQNHIFRIRELPIEPNVPAAYIPQLMMEMLALGPSCRSAVMVRQTATTGAVILRLHRDDEWISEMLFWLHRFMDDFVNKSEAPPPNFFWEDDQHGSCDRYRDFISRTKQISESVELVDFVSHKEIQRVVSADRRQLPLFLD
uniref:YqaJ viral recombinase domain-containing protein n=1 Tax=Pseudictyota dubia TaxID=2749911 RepID=A0A7R9VT58_9STRA|mmetsp:Transcript_22635/g.42121  ORF Transcript_22635/g.42121 Transcript_22635/m.42121 type:complete len:572 (+) Transcript_22635:206-1921(+)